MYFYLHEKNPYKPLQHSNNSHIYLKCADKKSGKDVLLILQKVF